MPDTQRTAVVDASAGTIEGSACVLHAKRLAGQ
jgi:hypothetical protein